MAKKSNKTSHVLNLITGSGTEAEAPVEEGVASAKPAAAPKQNPEPAPSVPVPSAQPEQKVIVIDEATENDKLSNTIKNSLADHLEKMEGQAVQEADSASEEMVKEELPPAQDVQKISEQELEQAAVSERVSESVLEPEKVPEAKAEEKVFETTPEPEEEPEVAYHMINVMEQILNRQNLLKQLNDYGVCTCSRCQSDVLALTLTRLPSKYVVVDKNSTTPIIGYYESKFKVRMFTEIMKACIKVKDEPRHEL